MRIIFLVLFCVGLCSWSRAEQPQADSIKAIRLNEVVVKGNPLSIRQSSDGSININVKRLDKLPQVMGTPDPIRLLQMYPGVASGSDVNTGLFVRGGDPSQNLMLLNGAPLINVMHFTGLFSTFVPDHLDGFALYKSYISPKYGGRVGGLLDVETRHDIPEQFETNIDVGFLASNMTLAVPVSSKIAFYLSGRLSYLSLYRSIVASMWKEKVSLAYDFGDINATLVGKPSAKDEWVLNFYAGGDDLGIEAGGMDTHGSIFWANTNLSLRWRHEAPNETKWENTVYTTSTRDRYGLYQGSQVFHLNSNATEYGLKSQMRKDSLLGGTVQLGGELLYRNAVPQVLQMEGGIYTPDSIRKEIGTLEYGLFAEWVKVWDDRVQLKIGMRNSGLYYKNEDNSIGHYGGWEPRFHLQYKSGEHHQYHFSYTLQRQYFNQVIVSKMGLPSDYWVPSSEGIPAQMSYGPSLGYRFINNVHDFSVELFYKRLENQFFSVMGMNELISQSHTLTDRFRVGDGYNYGAEVSWKLSLGSLTVLSSYTLSWAMRRCEQIDGDHYFPASNDRRHDISCLVQYPISKNWDFTAYGVYASGQPYTPSIGMYIISDRNIQLFGSYNSARFPDYHRLDVSFSRQLHWKWAKTSRLNLSIINLYGRQNPFFLHSTIEVATDPPSVSTVYRYISLFGILPSIGLTITL